MNLNRKITQYRSKQLLIENELNKLKTFDLGYFIGKSHFEEDGVQYYLVFQPITQYFRVIAKTNMISSSKCKGLSAETIKPPTTSDNTFAPTSSYSGTKTKLKFNESCLK